MITFNTFKATDGSPIYFQILRYIKRGAVAGTIRDGDELPSRRELSALLGINPNTVQKAFHMLEEEGLIESQTGTKSYMTLSESKIAQLREDLLGDEIRGITVALRQMGVSREEALRMIDRYWEEE
ncbi:MAG: GntR family transcriptional regulator [Lachnospiraceae bacterium]|nr:GntR family transcriptional regulator [Lachnospiraceae bacterium]MBR6020012.1 GntR family transcriptional regulator [Lachnospiraceae bacterium]